jgi:hypothetical protein
MVRALCCHDLVTYVENPADLPTKVLKLQEELASHVVELKSFGGYEDFFIEVVFGTVQHLFTNLAEYLPSTAVGIPAVLLESATIQGISSLRAALSQSYGARAAGRSDPSWKGGRAVEEALRGTFYGLRGGKIDQLLLRFLEFFAERVVGEQWGCADAWGDYYDYNADGDLFWVCSPLAAAAKEGYVDILPFLLEKAPRANKGAAALEAFRYGHAPAFEVLSGDEGCFVVELSKGRPVIAELFGDFGSDLTWETADLSWPELQERRLQMLVSLLSRHPQAARSEWVGSDGVIMTPLHAAVMTADTSVIEAVLAAGASISYECTTKEIRGTTGRVISTISFLLQHQCVLMKSPDGSDPGEMAEKFREVAELLVEKGALEDWQWRYNEEAQAALSRDLAWFALRMHPPNPPAIQVVVKLFLSSGFNYSFDDEGDNALLSRLFLGDSGTTPCELTESAALALLRLYHSHGMDVRHFQKKTVGKAEAETLLHEAARLGMSSILDFAVKTVSIPVDAVRAHPITGRMSTPLTLALYGGHFTVALRLLQVYKAQAVSPSLPPTGKALNLLLDGGEDRQSLPVLRELIRSEPQLLAVWAHTEPNVREMNPIELCAERNKLKCLELLLTSNLPFAEELCNRPIYRPAKYSPSLPEGSVVIETVAHDAAISGSWEMVHLLVAHHPKLLFASATTVGPDGKFIRRNPTLHGVISKAISRGGSNVPPRSLVTLVKLRAKQHEEEKAKQGKEGHSSAEDAVVLDTNAFEDTSKKIVTERQEKQKAKKKANKKKARAKKRAKAKEASAGAGKVCDDSDSSSHYEGSEEEEDEDEPGTEHLVDSRNAPDLTVMLAARKAARAKEEEMKERARKDKEGKK